MSKPGTVKPLPRPPLLPRPLRNETATNGSPPVTPRNENATHGPPPVAPRNENATHGPPSVAPRNESVTNGPTPSNPPPVSRKPVATSQPVPPNKPITSSSALPRPKQPVSYDYEKSSESLPGVIPVQKTPTSHQMSPVRDQDTPDSFGFCLQSARDCINKRHDDELKALESFRVYMHKRAKADAEYAATLGKINSQTAREMAGVGPDSIVVQVWLSCVLRHVCVLRLDPLGLRVRVSDCVRVCAFVCARACVCA